MARKNLALLQEDEVVVGKPLPFSVFGATQQLLLARGRVVESEYVRNLLLSKGAFSDRDDEDERAGNAAGEEEERTHVSPLAALRKDYSDLNGRSRLVLQMSADENGESYVSSVIGTHEKQSLIITAPLRADRALVPVKEGQKWLFRAMHATTALRFYTTIRKTMFEPFPHLHITPPVRVERKTIRSTPRALVCIDAEFDAESNVPCLIADVSVGGARIAVGAEHVLNKGQPLKLSIKLPLLAREFSLNIDCRVISAHGSLDARHPGVLFYGLHFTNLSDEQLLTLHGYVHERMSASLDYMLRIVNETAFQAANA